jgi:hypothetical protein
MGILAISGAPARHLIFSRKAVTRKISRDKMAASFMELIADAHLFWRYL